MFSWRFASRTGPVRMTRSMGPFPRAGWVRALLAGLALIAPLAPAGAEPPTLRGTLDRIFDNPVWRNARWGVKIVDLHTSAVLYARDADKGFMPASNLKLYTTAAALETLGPDYRFETRIYANGPVRGGVLKGDLVVVGSGDPSISGRYINDTPTTAILARWARAVRDAGIRRVQGSVVGDDNCFDDNHRAGSWQLDYFQEWYAAENSGLAINENCYDVLVTPGRKPGDPAKAQFQIPTRYLTLRNDVKTTGPAGKGAGDPAISLRRTLEGNEVTVTGTIPSDAAPFRLWGGVRNGTLYTATLFAEELARQGVRVDRGPADVDDLADGAKRSEPGRLRLIHLHQSQPLSRLLAIVNKPSQNFYADQLLKVIGKTGYGRGDFDAGERVVKDLLTTAGLDARGLQMVDGSGLSRQNLVEPRLTEGLLAYMATRPNFQVFLQSLPIAGVDGTLSRRMRGTAAENNVRAKTGYIGRVRSLSGYAVSRDRHTIAFSMMINNYLTDTKLVNDAQDSAALTMVNYTQVLDGDAALRNTTSPAEVTSTSAIISKTDYTQEQVPTKFVKTTEQGGTDSEPKM